MLTEPTVIPRDQFDRTNAFIAAAVFLASFVVYAMTVQPTFGFWDCGEFIACSVTLGIPHPPGTPLYILLGRLASVIPFVEDVSHRINYLSAISSAFTAMFSYLLAVRLIQYFYKGSVDNLGRHISYVGGIAGGFFVAFSSTNWANSVEAEVYGLALALSVAIFWLTLRYWDRRGQPGAARWMILAMYLAMLGIGIHMTVFLVVPVCALFFIFKQETTARDWVYVCGFVIVELLLIMLFANGRGGVAAFYAVTAVLSVALLILLYKKINWAIVIAVGATSSLMVSFAVYIEAVPLALLVLIVLALLARQQKWNLQWKSGMAILLVGLLGISVHAFLPIRSGLNPRIDENNPSRDWRTFVNYLDRKQYGQESMVERMFHRRGEWANQFGRHPHMGFWSYFEEQYSGAGVQFIIPFFALGLIGLYVAIRKRLEIGLPFLTLILICSVGLILYMNFADGTKYDFRTGDAYLEVRNRDYFFTPAFVFFGIAMGVGVGAVLQIAREKLQGNEGTQRKLVYAGSVLALLPALSLANNWHECDSSGNFIPYHYARNILIGCPENTILFTSGDNDTFPLWAMQEAYNYRRDVRVANLSLLNTDWYVEQMKNRYDVPISLSDSQILWFPTEMAGQEIQRPRKPFVDRARKRQTFLTAGRHGDRVVRVQDMMVDDIVWESTYSENDSLKLSVPIYFSSPPYAESPLKLREHAQLEGILYKLDWNLDRQVNVDRSWELFMEEYELVGYEDSEVYRDENATGVFITYGVNGGRLFDELVADGREDDAIALGKHLIAKYPEYWQTYMILGDLYEKRGDTAKADTLWIQLNDTLTSFLESNPRNLFYMQDLGMCKVELGQRRNDPELTQQGVDLCWKAFMANRNSSYAFRKLVTALSRTGQFNEIRRAAQLHAEYKVNQQDQFLQQLLGQSAPSGMPPQPGS